MTGSSSKPVVVIGDGWSALGSVAFLISSGIEVKWLVGSGTRIQVPLGSLEWGPGVAIWQDLASKMGLELGEVQTGVWVREFRNKAFREPLWIKAATPEERLNVKNDLLWGPERQLVGVFEARWDETTPAELEEDIRKILVSGRYPHLSRIEGVPLVGFVKNGDEVCAVKLGSGTQIECSQVIYADCWGLLPTLEGLPKALSFLRKREPVGVLQASFVHDFELATGTPRQSFFAPLFRAGPKEVERHVWGHFSSDGTKSVWTLCLSAEEIEDNHEIAKKLRRLKGTLDRMFQGSDLIPAGKADFSSTILAEQVRFEEEVYFSEGHPLEEPVKVDSISGIQFLTDGYGPSRAFQQVSSMLGVGLDSQSLESKGIADVKGLDLDR